MRRIFDVTMTRIRDRILAIERMIPQMSKKEVLEAKLELAELLETTQEFERVITEEHSQLVN